ncbi:hypothetical protein NC653_018742 [Populus alba x Populus x berolinensis]|uniref:Integrase catalytic domain-containing protein n=1 Tax=Populus alba x Populus x berolinensis TaxID=444605 RepID=A0AAD6VVZ7_9ROSI|nr:hypothetical protein NC653_018742 [Populus alba x Populus x berolinensis]
MAYLQQFHLMIKYKKGSHNKLADMLSRPPVTALCLSVFMQVQPTLHEEYIDWYKEDPDFQKALAEDVARFVSGCVMCSTSKLANRKVGLYTPLPVPTRPWESISMDFLGGLPMTRRGNDYLYLASLNSIVSDRDSRFLSKFWCALWAMMDTKLKRSTAFHPQSDGQTEVVNKTIVHLLRGYNARHPKTWDESIPFLQFAINHTLHSSTNKSLSEVCSGFSPQSPFDLEITIESTSQLEKGEGDRIRATTVISKKVTLFGCIWAKDRLLGEGKKLMPIRCGPFKIIRKIGDNACQLELPAFMEMYSVVIVEKLKLFEPSMLDDEPNGTLPTVEDLVTEKEGYTIVERKTITTRRGARESFRIGRKGQRPSETKWFSREAGQAQFPRLQF